MKLTTSTVGSHGLPGWVWLAREALEQNRLGAIDVRELMEDATQAALLDQERAGVDVLTTGEMMRVRFIIGFYDRIAGIRALPAPRRLGQPLWDTNTPCEVVDKISAPHGLGIVDEWKLARSLTTKPLKATVPGPYTLVVPLKLAGGYRDKDTLVSDLVDIVIDTGVPIEDALIQLEGFERPVGGASTIVACAAVSQIMVHTAVELQNRGITPPIFVSPTVPGASVQSNDEVFAAHRKRLMTAAARV